MNTLKPERRAAVIRCLVEGNSIRSTVRITGVAKNTVVKLLVDLGGACAVTHDRLIRNVKSQRVQCDEIWSFVGCKEKNVSTEGDRFGRGDVWTWTAIDADTKLMILYQIGPRDAESAYEFMKGVAGRLANRVQLTTDGLGVYLQAVQFAFSGKIDYAMLIKHYGKDSAENEKRYSPAKFTSAEPKPMIGKPDPEHISTSFVERQNLTMRMGMRRFTRLTNAFSKKIENHFYAIALHFAHYNFCRVHKTLKTTPAVAAGIADHVWTIEELVGLLDQMPAKTNSN